MGLGQLQPGCGCCGPNNCEGCCSSALTSSDSFTVNLGPSFLTVNPDHTGWCCSEWSGEFVVNAGSACTYNYSTFLSCDGGTAYLQIGIAQEYDSASGKCYWIVGVSAGGPPYTSPQASYVSLKTDPTVFNCRNSGPWTLTLCTGASDQWGPCDEVSPPNNPGVPYLPCLGTWPSTITLTLN